MYVRLSFLLAVLGLASCIWATTPLASLATDGPFTLSGTQIISSGVSSLPLVSGDEIITTSHPALVLFPDMSRVTIGKNSRVRVDGDRAKPAVHVLGGTVDYKFTPGSAVRLFDARKQPFTEAKNGTEGAVTIKGDRMVRVSASQARTVNTAADPPPASRRTR